MDESIQDQYNRSAFNMGLATLERMNNLLLKSSESFIKLDVITIKSTLQELYKEVFVYMKNDEINKCNQIFEDISKSYLKNVDGRTIKFDMKLVYYLNEFDLYIRQIMHKKGLLMPKSDDAGNVMIRTKGY